jgi:hypothetical protein
MGASFTVLNLTVTGVEQSEKQDWSGISSKYMVEISRKVSLYDTLGFLLMLVQ